MKTKIIIVIITVLTTAFVTDTLIGYHYWKQLQIAKKNFIETKNQLIQTQNLAKQLQTTLLNIKEAQDKAAALERLPQLLQDIANAQKAGVISPETANQYQDYLDKKTPLYLAPDQKQKALALYPDLNEHDAILLALENGQITMTTNAFSVAPP
jgi:hypothetical protein